MRAVLDVFKAVLSIDQFGRMPLAVKKEVSSYPRVFIDMTAL